MVPFSGFVDISHELRYNEMVWKIMPGKDRVIMKVQELRNLLSNADKNLTDKAFVEVYKNLTKSKKEELDDVIMGILEGREEKKEPKKVQMDFETLDREIRFFVENAYAQNYFAPNRVIPKNQRPKWRFLVKNYIKELEKIQVESPDFPQGVKLLTDLYHVLCYGCNCYIFSTDDPFRSIGWEQEKLFSMVVKKTFSLGYTRENIKSVLLDACTGGLGSESLYQWNMMAILPEFKTSDVKYMAIEIAKGIIDEKRDKLKTLGKWANGRYELEEVINNLCDMILLISIALSEPELGVDYYFRTCIESDKEIVLYRALRLIDAMDEDQLWLDVYHYGLKAKIKPGSELEAEFARRTEQGETEK